MTSQSQVDAYDNIDRYLRNSLDDTAYTEYSTYLDTIYNFNDVKVMQLSESIQTPNTSIDSQSENKESDEGIHYKKLLDFAKDTISKMKPGETRYVGRYSYDPGKEDAKETHAKMTATGKVNFYHKNGLSGTLISAKNYDTNSNSNKD